MAGRAPAPLRVPPGFWGRPEVGEALAGRQFGVLFRLLAKYAGASQTQLAIAVGMTQGQVSVIAAGDRQVTALDVAERVLDGLDAPDTARLRFGLAPRQRTALDSRDDPARTNLVTNPPSCTHDAVEQLRAGHWRTAAPTTMSVAPDPAGDDVGAGWPVERLHGLCALPVAERDGMSTSTTVEKQVAELVHEAQSGDRDGIAAFFGQEIECCKADDGVRGAGSALPRMRVVLGAIARLARDATLSLRPALLAVGAQGAEFAGWLHRDRGDLAPATFWYDRAMEWAQQADSDVLQAYVLLRKSQMAYDARDGGRVTALAQAAHRFQRQVPGPVRAEVVQQVALGLAMTGAPMTTVDKTMDEAWMVLTSVARETDGFSVSEDTMLLRRATCYTEAGKPAAGAAIFADVLARDGLSARDTGFFRARRALALALSGEPDEAAQVGMTALATADATSSRRTRLVLVDTAQGLARWRGRPGPRELIEALAISQ